MADPQVCSTAVMAMRAPRCLGSAPIVIAVCGRGLEKQLVDDALVLIAIAPIAETAV